MTGCDRIQQEADSKTRVHCGTEEAESQVSIEGLQYQYCKIYAREGGNNLLVSYIENCKLRKIPHLLIAELLL